MKAKRILRHRSEIADPLRPHTPEILPNANQRLHERLHEWQPECAPLPPHFAEQVWRRIRRSEEQAAQTHALPIEDERKAAESAFKQAQ